MNRVPRSLVVTAVVLCATLAVLDVAAFREADRIAAVERLSPTYANGARDYELRRLGRRVPAGAYARGRAHLQRMRDAFFKRHGRAARQIEMTSATETSGTTVAASTPSSASVAAAPSVSPRGWRWLGPGNIGGRVRAIVVDPTSPDTLFAGSAGGGIWKTTNGGASWAPVDDFLPVLSVASLAIDPINPAVMYAGTGEGYQNFDAIRGAGLFRSADHGATWAQVPSTKTFPAVNRVAISPDGRTILIACAGSGVWRSTDNGATFSEVTFSGAERILGNQVLFHPTDSRRALAAGADGTIGYSSDGGLTWRKASSGSLGARTELAYARSQPAIVYASVNSNSGSLYRSTDGGVTFSLVYDGSLLGMQGWFNNVIWVDPTDPNHVLVGGTPLWESRNGGTSWNQIDIFGSHVDFHAIVEQPGFNGSSRQTVFVGNDGGVYRADLGTLGSGGQFESLNNNLGVTQFYGAAGNPASGVVFGGTQDNGSLRYRPTAGTNWDAVAGGDGGFAEADPADHNYFYGEYTYLQLYRSTDGGGAVAPIFGGIRDAGRAANFIAPFVLDPNNAKRMLAGGSSLWATEDVKAATPAWRAIKPPPPDSTNYVSAITVAPSSSDIIWVGHELGDVYRTTNGRASTPTWTRLQTPISYLTVVTHIAVDPFDANTVYVTTGGFGEVHIIKSVDGGATWTTATGGGDQALPDAPVYDLQIDPSNDRVLYAATEMGVFISTDAGGTWELPQDGPANVSVERLFWMGSTLVAATHGRGLFAIDVAAAASAALTVTPEQIDFAPQPLSTTSGARSVKVANSGTVSVTVQAVWVANYDGKAFTSSTACTGVTLAPGASCQIAVTFTPRSAGSSAATLWIDSTAPGSPVDVALTGTTGAPASLPSPWSSQDVGDVGAAGSSSLSGAVFALSGAGADIWNAADGFQFTYQKLTGDGTIVARLASLDNVAAWTKAGVMMRQSLDAGSAHAAMLVSSGKGLAFQRRLVAGGTSIHTSGGVGAAPRWIRLTRAGNVVTAATSADGSAWTTVGQDTFAFTSTIYVGLVVSSHVTGQLASASFDGVAVLPGASTPSLPGGFATADVGSVGQRGSASASNGIVTVKGAGADVWGSADAFRFVYRQLSGDGSVVARVRTIQNVAAWTKTGVMLRQSLDPSSAHAFMIVSSGKGLAFQRRTSAGGATTSSTLVAGNAPMWVKLVRSGQIVTAYSSADGASWTRVGQDTIGFSGAIWAGLAVSSHDPAVAAAATFEQVAVTAGDTWPASWKHADVGAVGAAGTASFGAGVFAVSGAGADVWGAADAFHYAYTTLSGDGQLTAHIATVADVNRWSKAGVMIRATTAANSAYGFMLVSAEKGSAFQFRTAAGALASNVTGTPIAAPYWVKIVRAGSTVSGYQSADGTTWEKVGTATLSMPASVAIGLAVSSHDVTRLCKARFDGVTE